MPYPVHLLPSAENITHFLSASMPSLSVTVLDTVDSTNTEARRRMASGAEVPQLIVALTQTQGRGRLGRSFHSPHGSGLYMTFAFDSPLPLDRLSSVTPVAAVATAKAISEVCDKEVAIKWVNDLYLDGKKVGGILTEAVTADGGHRVIVGIGINITTRVFPDGMRNPAGAVLAEDDPPVDQSLLCARIVELLTKLLRPENAQLCLSVYRERLCMVGQRVACHRHFPSDDEKDSDSGTKGILLGVDEDYGLILQQDDGRVQVMRGGEISLALKA